ncbi:hypothetical protein FQZ97_1103150 [compost metagenome]
MHAGAHSRSKRQATGLAFAHVKRRLGQVVLDELHLHKTVVRDDGEGGFERRLQALVGALLGSRIGLQERGVRVLLHLQEVRDRDDGFAGAKTLSDAFAFGV